MPASAPSTPGRALSTALGVVVALLAGALLWWGFVAFAFYGVCEDNCDKPTRAIGPAILAGLPFALLGLVIVVAACYLLTHGRRPSVIKAIGLGVYSSAGFSPAYRSSTLRPMPTRQSSSGCRWWLPYGSWRPLRSLAAGQAPRAHSRL